MALQARRPRPQGHGNTFARGPIWHNVAQFPLAVIRFGFKVLPPPARERLAVRLFLSQPDHAEPERERDWRQRGEEIRVAGCAAVAFGAPDAPAAILMHGWAGRGLQLSAYIEPLVAAGYRVVAMDGPGHGRTSSGLPGLPTMAAALEQAIGELGAELVVAHSVGAAAAIVAAARTGFQGRLLCLAGPPDPYNIFTRARGFMGLPESGRPRFMRYLADRVRPVRFDDVMDIEARGRSLGSRLMAILPAGDDSVPVEEAQGLVERAGGAAVVLHGPNHRNIMWDPAAVQAGLAFLLDSSQPRQSSQQHPPGLPPAARVAA